MQTDIGSVGFVCVEINKLYIVAASALLLSCADQRASNSAKNSSAGGGNPPPASGGSTPAAPSNMNATSISSSQITITWADNSANETGFRIERAFENSGPFSQGSGPGLFQTLATVNANIRTFTDKNLIAVTNYYYRVVALNGTLASQPTSYAMATTQQLPSNPPSPPSMLTATAAAATVLDLRWSDNSNNEDYFSIERSSNGGTTFTPIGTGSANLTSFRDFNLSAAASYVYRVRAINVVGNSNYTANATITMPAAGNTNTWTYIAANIVGPNCVDCHGPSLQAAGYNFSTYAGFANSRTAAMNAINGGRMPPGAPLSISQISILQSWINSGALNN